jgi:hypothetical protein
VDNRLGMMFHHRRVSRDRVVSQDILEMCRGSRLYVAEASLTLFPEFDSEVIRVGEPDEEQAYVFAENPDDIQTSRYDELILYRWNRTYPADQYLMIDWEDWHLADSSEFPGYSHEKITKEIYKKVL